HIQTVRSNTLTPHTFTPASTPSRCTHLFSLLLHLKSLQSSTPPSQKSSSQKSLPQCRHHPRPVRSSTNTRVRGFPFLVCVFTLQLINQALLRLKTRQHVGTLYTVIQIDIMRLRELHSMPQPRF
ncbi:hypothetical protein CFOL_v3_09530, partial [Cephalotus follicularis]